MPPMTKVPLVPFGRLCASAVASWDTKLPSARLRVPMQSTVQLLLTGKLTGSSPKPVNQSVSCSMYEGTASHQGLFSMAHILVPSVATPSMLPPHAPKTDLSEIVYIHTTPYIAANWKSALDLCNISNLFPDLVNNSTLGSPIGNPPPLPRTFLP